MNRLFRFLFPVMGILVCISLFRASNGSGPISISSMLVDLSAFNYTFDSIQYLIDFFATGDFLDTFVSWDSSLVGLEGFFINIKNVVTSFFVTLGSIFSVCLRGSWEMLVEFITLLGSIFKVFSYILGYA